MKTQLAFIDEFGNFGYDFEKENVSSHFIISAIILNKEELHLLEDGLEPIRKKHFQQGEMKSSKVGSNDERRIRILHDLKELDYHLFIFVIDKRKLQSKGLKYKKSFLKFLHGLVESKLYKTYPELRITADAVGSKEFMDGFIDYVQRRHIPDLFNYSAFGFESSKSNILIQLSDFMCGTVAKAFNRTVFSENSHKFLSLLKEKTIEIDEWPRDFKPYIYRYNEEAGPKFDPLVAQQSIASAQLFIEKNEKENDTAPENQIACLKFLLFHILIITNMYQHRK